MMDAATEMDFEKARLGATTVRGAPDREKPSEALACLWAEVAASGGSPVWKNLFLALFRANACVIISYRLRRFFLLAGGRFAGVACVLTSPLLLWCRLVGGRHEFPAEARIGRGLSIAHPCRPCVLSEWLIAGRNLYLTGGNVIGVRRRVQPGQLVIGDDCMLGIDAKVIGPLKLGNQVRVGAGAVVVRDCVGPATLVGVPAKQIVEI